MNYGLGAQSLVLVESTRPKLLVCKEKVFNKKPHAMPVIIANGLIRASCIAGLNRNNVL